MPIILSQVSTHIICRRINRREKAFEGAPARSDCEHYPADQVVGTTRSRATLAQTGAILDGDAGLAINR
jgi:hypothetical protein